MSASPPATASGTDRTRLAHLALAAALSVDGVLAPDAGRARMHLTGDGTTVLRGVRVTADAGGRYCVDLGLQARLEPLEPLAGRIRERVTRSAGLAGLEARLGEITVTFHEVLDADEVAAAALADALAAAVPEPLP